MKLEECTTLDDVREHFAYRGAHKNPWIIMTVTRIMTADCEFNDLEEIAQASDDSINWLRQNVNESLPSIKDAISQILGC